jgi:integrase
MDSAVSAANEIVIETDLTKSVHNLALRWCAERLRTGEIQPITAKTQRQTLDLLCVHLPARSKLITAAHIADWQASMSDLAPGTRRTRWSVAVKFLDHLVETDRLRSNPMRKMKAPKVPRSVHRALPHDQVKACLEACRGIRDELVILLGVQLGLRRAEMAGLEWGDVVLSSRPILIVHGKGGHIRTVPLTADAVEILRAWQSEARNGGRAGPVFESPYRTGEGIRAETLGRWVQAIMEEAAVKHHAGDGMSTHALRHTAATDVYHAHHDVVAVRDMLGHQSLQTTETYVAGLDVEGLRQAMEGRDYYHWSPVEDVDDEDSA